MCLCVSLFVCPCIMYVQCLHWPEKDIGLLEKRVIESEFLLGIKSRSTGRRVSSLNGASLNGCTAHKPSSLCCHCYFILYETLLTTMCKNLNSILYYIVIFIDRSVIDIIEIYCYLQDKVEQKNLKKQQKITKVSISIVYFL